MKYIFLLMFSVVALAQPDIATIVENDPFDPDRGKKDIAEEEILEEEAPVPLDLPTLDGTMVIGKKKIALFSYMEEGKKRYKSASINEVVAGYKITQIQDRQVELFGNGSPVNVSLFSGDKTNRGGSKKSQAKASPQNSRPNVVAQPSRPADSEPQIISPEAEPDGQKKPEKRFVPRKPPSKTQTPQTEDKSKRQFKNRF